MFIAPDRIIVIYDGSTVVDTGYRGATSYDFGGVDRATFNASLNGLVDPISGLTYPNAGVTDARPDGYPSVTANPNVLVDPGVGVAIFNKGTSSPTSCTVRVYAPLTGSQWQYQVNCPAITTTTTSTTLVPTTTTTTTNLLPDFIATEADDPITTEADDNLITE
jgi:hypothetical protein